MEACGGLDAAQLARGLAVLGTAAAHGAQEPRDVALVPVALLVLRNARSVARKRQVTVLAVVLAIVVFVTRHLQFSLSVSQSFKGKKRDIGKRLDELRVSDGLTLC